MNISGGAAIFNKKIGALLEILGCFCHKVLFIAWYNRARSYVVLKNTAPAMASKLVDHIWTIKELIENATQ